MMIRYSTFLLTLLICLTDVDGRKKRDYYKDIGRDTVPKNLDDYRIRSNLLGAGGPRRDRRTFIIEPEAPAYPQIQPLYDKYP